ncbi:baeRF2 domain-containing protein [Streptomyces lancefieldiae]|uniref:Vms1/Ankzf1 family peptidyl-tRNA hydrolase n=1 Tax=Streptomyces lancefieldiae TaxID=3075520 RepID=A0ABU3ASH1_9ACTN|nr:Vms1/Ankzf1 family peptidyl-tRNA hydrolase [Streptomyces sp. DSM 40712]MDT0613135.1 Vms1/Ankzf1 family peptidyl-tRNA hydrolase [Streptomyces sp. DSM 40712]
MDLAFLHPLYEHQGPWASVYVDLSRHTEDTPHERELTAAAVARELAEQGADDATCRAVQEAVDGLRHATDPHGRALFACAGRVILDPPLARPPYGGTTADWAPLPHVAPLLELAGEDPVCVVAYIDRKGADFELRSALGSSDAGGVTGRQWPVHRTSSVDWSERHFQLRVENTWEHNAAEIADALAVCQEETGADLLILVGEDRERRSVHERLPKRLQDRIAESSRGAGSRLLDDEVERLRDDHVRSRAREDLDRFLAARTPDGEGRAGAAEGVPALVEAAREHRIDELLIIPDAPDTHREVWIGEDADQLAVRRTELKTLGEQNSWAARADDALLRSAVMTGAPAISVTPALPSEAADKTPVGGLGALLRWK